MKNKAADVKQKIASFSAGKKFEKDTRPKKPLLWVSDTLASYRSIVATSEGVNDRNYILTNTWLLPS